MNTTSSQKFSLGRTSLVYKTDLYTYRNGILSFLGMCFFSLFALPRIELLTGMSYDTWASGYANEYDYIGSMLMVHMLATAVGTWYINRRLFKPTPMSFGLVPAALGEKLLAIGLVVLSIHVGTQAVHALSILLDYLTVPQLEVPSPIRIVNALTSAYHKFNMMSYEFVGLCAFMLSLELLLIISAVYIRNFGLAMLTSIFAPILIVLILAGLGLTLSIDSDGMRGDVLFFNGVFCTLDLLLLVGIIHRFRTVSH